MERIRQLDTELISSGSSPRRVDEVFMAPKESLRQPESVGERLGKSLALASDFPSDAP